MPKIPYKLSIHDKPVYQTLFENLRLKYPDSYPDGWFCDGKEKGIGCKDNDNPNGCHNDADEVEHWHCVECKFDFCLQCYEVYGTKHHHHDLKKMSMTQMNEAHENAYKNGWWCDGRHIQNSACKKLGRDQDPFSVVYHCDEDSLDFCETCYDTFRV